MQGQLPRGRRPLRLLLALAVIVNVTDFFVAGMFCTEVKFPNNGTAFHTTCRQRIKEPLRTVQCSLHYLANGQRVRVTMDSEMHRYYLSTMEAVCEYRFDVSHLEKAGSHVFKLYLMYGAELYVETKRLDLRLPSVQIKGCDNSSMYTTGTGTPTSCTCVLQDSGRPHGKAVWYHGEDVIASTNKTGSGAVLYLEQTAMGMTRNEHYRCVGQSVLGNKTITLKQGPSKVVPTKEPMTSYKNESTHLAQTQPIGLAKEETANPDLSQEPENHVQNEPANFVQKGPASPGQEGASANLHQEEPDNSLRQKKPANPNQEKTGNLELGLHTVANESYDSLGFRFSIVKNNNRVTDIAVENATALLNTTEGDDVTITCVASCGNISVQNHVISCQSTSRQFINQGKHMLLPNIGKEHDGLECKCRHSGPQQHVNGCHDDNSQNEVMLKVKVKAMKTAGFYFDGKEADGRESRCLPAFQDVLFCVTAFFLSATLLMVTWKKLFKDRIYAYEGAKEGMRRTKEERIKGGKAMTEYYFDDVNPYEEL